MRFTDVVMSMPRLMLDEPTSALAVFVLAEILNLLNRLKQQSGMTCLLVSHDAEVIAHMSDRTALVRGAHWMDSE